MTDESNSDTAAAGTPARQTYRIWVTPMLFKKNGFPSVGTFGASESNVVIMTTATWKKLCEDVPQLQTTQFEVGAQHGD